MNVATDRVYYQRTKLRFSETIFVFNWCVRGKAHPFDSSTSIVDQIEYKLEILNSTQQEIVIIDS